MIRRALREFTFFTVIGVAVIIGFWVPQALAIDLSRLGPSERENVSEPTLSEFWGLKDLTSTAMLVPPTISSISPSSPQRSVTDQIVRVNGTNFASGLTVTVTFPGGGTGTLSGSQIQNRTSTRFDMVVTLNATGTWQIRVNNPNGEVSSQFQFSVVTAQTPSISSISPSSPTVSSSNQNVQVSGSNFQNGLTVTVFFPGGGSSTLSGTQIQFNSTSSITIVVTLNLQGTYGIRVNNPSGLNSNTFNFQTQQPSPTISSISPSGVCAQSGDRNFSVSGSNFVSGLTVTVFFPGGGSTTLSGSQIQNVTSTSFTMTVTLNVVGTYNFRVNNPSGAQSSQFPYTTQNCNPTISSINPSSPTVSNSDQTVSVSGSNFQSGLTVTIFFPGGGSGTLSGSQIQFQSSSSFNMIVTLNVVGQYQIRVNNPNGTTSSNFSFSTQAAAPSITSISPASPCVRNIDQSVTVNGSNFASGLTVSVSFPGGGSGTLSGSQIQSVTANSFTMIITLADPGTYGIRVINPGGSQSNLLNFTPQNCASVSGINPSSPTQSNVNQDVLVSGSNFAANLTVIVTLPDNSTVTLSGAQILNVTSTSFTMRVTLNATGQWRIKVRNPNGDLSNIFTFSVQAPAPPTVTSINPASPVASNVDQNVTVNGSNFQSGLTITVTFPSGGTATLSGTQIQNVSAGSLTMRITFAAAGTWCIRVNNPNGGQSSVFCFTVQSGVQAPSVYSINPATPVASNSDQDVSVSGNGYQQGLTVTITFPSGGSTTLSGSQIQNVTSTSFIMRATMNATGAWSIRVNNPNGGQSAAFGFSVVGGSGSTITSINPSSPIANGADQNVTVNGSGFQSNLRVNVTFPSGGMATLQGNGQIQNVTSGSFLMRITLNAPGSWTIRVVNPDNSQSQQFAFNVQPSGPPPTGLPTSVLSPVIGPLRVTTSNQGINDGKWEFNQHGTGYHTPTGGVSLSNDRYAWDANLYMPANGNGDVGKAVFATAPGQVVRFVGLLPGDGPGAVLVAHPNASSPIWFSGYLHLKNVRVSIDQFVDSNTLLGDVGNIGASNDHLHFAVYSGTNSRGNLRSFNVTISERNNIQGQVDSIVPAQVTRSASLQSITINGMGFPSDPLIEVTDRNGRKFTIIPEPSIGARAGERITSVSPTAISAQVAFGIEGRYEFAVVSRTPNTLAPSPTNIAPLSDNNVVTANAGPPRTPIVLIPGMLGSRLKKRDLGFDSELFPHVPYWVPTASDQHRQLRNNVGDTRPMDQRTVYPSDVFREYAGNNIPGDTDYYERLISSFFRDRHGYVEYDATNRPERRTNAGCDTSQAGANLFLFAYDWRNSNAQSAKELFDFVQCIRRITPGGNTASFKFQIVAHSNGGLVARRYILDGYYGLEQNYEPRVERMITLGTPWLGAPKAIPAIMKGEFEGVNNLIHRDVMREIAPYLTGAHELLPSPLYINNLGDVTAPATLGDYVIGDSARPYPFEWFKNLMNAIQSGTTPGTNTEVFHNRLFNGRRLQDDWTNDATAEQIKYYNFRGKTASSSTIGTTLISGNQLVLHPVEGDGTVTSRSAKRQSSWGNYLGTVTDKEFVGVNHQKLTSDSRVWAKIECVLEQSNPDTCINNPIVDPDRVGGPETQELQYMLRLSGTNNVSIVDSYGNTTQPFSNSEEEGVRTIKNMVTGQDYLTSLIPLDQTYEIRFRSTGAPLNLTLFRSSKDVTDLAIRYVDVVIPNSLFARFVVGPAGVVGLAYDSDGNGTFDTPVNPTISVTGSQAQDIEPPTVFVNETVQSGSSHIVLQATDAGTGVQRIMYSLNGTTYQLYTTALTLNPVTTPTIYVFADDNVFNRSGVVTHNLTPSTSGFSVANSSPSGTQIAANWVAPIGRPIDDWIGLFRADTLNSAYISKQFTGGQSSGTLNFTLPTQPGSYEFRYLLNDGFTSVAKSAGFTIGNTRRAAFDFDGDSKTDIGIYRPNGVSGSEWWLQRSSNGSGFATQFGAPTDKIAAADYTGDGKTDVAFWRPSTGFWYVLRSEDQTFYAFPFGTNGDVPVPSDYDADGKADVGVFRPSSSTWFIQRSSDNGTTIQAFGIAGDVPANADYDGDGKSDIAIYRPSLGQWWLLRSSAGAIAYQFGSPTDKTVQGDYTGDGKADVAFWRPATGEWYVLRSEDSSFFAFPFGIATDTPVPGDYDGDGRNDAGVFRSSSNTWFIQRSTAGTLIQQFGTTGDLPLPNAYVR